jgi:hypothetical protein
MDLPPALKDAASFRRCAYCKSKATCVAKAKCLLKKEAREFSLNFNPNDGVLGRLIELNARLERIMGDNLTELDDDIIAEQTGKWKQNKDGNWYQEKKVLRKKPASKKKKQTVIKDPKDLPGGSPPTAQEKANIAKQNAALRQIKETGSLESQETKDRKMSAHEAQKKNKRHRRVTGRTTGDARAGRKGLTPRPHGSRKFQISELNPQKRMSDHPESVLAETAKKVRSRLSNKGVKRPIEKVLGIIKQLKVFQVISILKTGKLPKRFK